MRYEKDRWIGKQIWVTLNKNEEVILYKHFLFNKWFLWITKVDKSKGINETNQQQNNEDIETPEPGNLTVRPTVGGTNCIIIPLSQRIDIIVNIDITFFNSHKNLC